MYTAEVGRNGVVVSRIEASTPTRQAHHLLLGTLVLAVIAVGADKLLHVLADWNALIAPQILARFPFPPHRLMLAAGALEVVLALLTLAKPRVGGILLGIALLLMVVNLAFARQDLAIALLDLVLAVIAFSVSRLATAYSRVTALTE